MASVGIHSVSKCYGDVVALSDVSLEIADGELIVLVGPSGCGKTTLLRLVAGLEKESGGEIDIGGAPMKGVPAMDRDLAMVFQNYALYPHMSVAENMGFGLRMRGTRKRERTSVVTRAAGMLGLDGLLVRLPAELSGGQRQRVAMGRAISRRPAVFLMDEPLSNLDAELRVLVRREIKTLQRRLGVTTIYVTHDQVEAMTLADRIVVFLDGRLQQIGTPETLYHRPANRFVGGFLGTPPMNLIDGEIAEGRLHAPGLTPLVLPGMALPSGPTTLGLRPEHMRLGTADAHWHGRIEAVEWLGGDKLVHVANGDARLTLRLSGPIQVREGDAAGVTFDLSAIHVFDAAGSAHPKHPERPNT